MRKKPSCFYSVYVIGPVVHWNLFVLGVTVRYLGVILDPSEDIEHHIKKIYKTCHFHLTNISRIRTCIWIVNLLKQLFMLSWLPTWITVSNAILYGLSKVLLNCLQLVQNRAARIVTFTKKYEHIAPSLIDLHWSPVEYRIIYKISFLVYKAINRFAPSYISNLLSFCNSSFSLRSCSNKLLCWTKLKSYGDRRFSFAGPKLWNSIPAPLRNANSLNSFKKHL